MVCEHDWRLFSTVKEETREFVRLACILCGETKAVLLTGDGINVFPE